jgi:predicted lactoylglutathione lyase
MSRNVEISSTDPLHTETIMAQQIFVNLPVKNLKRSIEFFSNLGFTFNPQFTDDTATCMIINDTIFVMLLTHDKFKAFTPNPICDATKSTEAIICLNRESRDGVDDIVDKAINAGGRTFSEPQAHGFMYGRGFQDLDGHIWEFVWMNPNAVQNA